jgi:D-3-phosphoglycerate dehydrogenase
MTRTPVAHFRIWLDQDVPPYVAERLEAEAKLIGPRRNDAKPDSFVGIEDADAALITSRLAWITDVFRRAPRLRVLARSGIGVDNIDLAAATAHQVVVVNTPDAPTESTAEHAVALILALARRLPAAGRAAQVRDFSHSPDLLGIELLGRTLGLVGLGRIGRRVAEIGRVLGMRVLAYDPYVAPDAVAGLGVTLVSELTTLFAQADVVSLHAPLTPETRGLIGARELAAMKPGALLINCARGPLVDEAALAAALTDGRLGGAGLDVFHTEPPEPGNPLLALDHPNLILSPHVASFTEAGVRKMFVGAAEQVLQVLHGERPPHLVNPEVWPTN